MLFQLGLNYSSVEQHDSNIAKLLGIRNAIAHGDRLKVPTDDELSKYITVAFDVMGFLQGEVFAALKNQVYLRRPPEQPGAPPPLAEGPNQLQ